LELAEHVAAAPIGTLHSLCARMLGEFPELSGVPPDPRPLEPAEQLLEPDALVSSWLDRVTGAPRHRAPPGSAALHGAPPPGSARSRTRVGRRRCGDWVGQLQRPRPLLARACARALRRGRSSAKLVELGERIARLQRRHGPEPDLSCVLADVQELVSQGPRNELGPVAAMLVQLRNHHKVIATRRERPVLPDPRACLQTGQAQHLARWIALATAAREDWAASLQHRAVLRYDDLELLARRLLDAPPAPAP